MWGDGLPARRPIDLGGECAGAERGAQRAPAAHRRVGGLEPGRATGEASARWRARAAGVPAVEHAEGAAFAAVVRAIGPGAGRGAVGSTELSQVCRTARA